MRIAAINTLPNGSTGTIMRGILDAAKEKMAVEYISFYGNYGSRKDCPQTYAGSLRYGYRIENLCNALVSRVTGFHNVLSIFGTLSLIKKIDAFKPDIIHLHNLHLWTICLPLLFHYIKKQQIKTIWTLHDCWSFTGQCPHFTMAKCDKWKTGCHDCPQIHVYPSSMVDRTRTMWKLKRKWFTGVEDMTIVTPSEWLAGLVRQSYLKEYPVKVIHNGIDLNVFHPVESDFRQKHHLEDKYILLGVAFGWGKRKGLDVFIELSKRLDERFQIVLVGTNDEIDKQLPANIISVHKTNNQKELAEIYSAADLFVNPTREENYPTVNMESIACGTPVLTFNTGGSPEIPDDKTGYVVDVDDIDEMEKQIIRICTAKIFSTDDCLKRAKAFDAVKKFQEYIGLYRQSPQKDKAM